MPQYQLLFRVEACLTRREDLEVPYGDDGVKFLFSKKRAEDKNVLVQAECDAPNNRVAHGLASSTTIPPILDALSFATGTPLLLRDCQLTLKDQSGSRTRHAIYVAVEQRHRRVPLTDEAIRDAEQILLADGPPKLPLCWHRYALDRQLAPEQFVFQWLAFEGLAGDADIPTRCPKCQTAMVHCESDVTHRGSSKIAARDIFLRANPTTTPKEFSERIWGTARNSIFHGRKYPTPQYLAELNTYTGLLSKATENEIRKIFQLENRERQRLAYQQTDLIHLFIQWETGDPNARFADDCPTALLEQIAREDHQALAMADRTGVKILDYNRDSPDW